MDCVATRRVLMTRMEAEPMDGPLAEHLESCPVCAAKWAEERALWHALEAHDAPPLGEAAGMRIRRELASALEAGASPGTFWERVLPRHRSGRPAPSFGSWAVVGAAVLLGLGAGGWLGLGARELLAGGSGGAGYELPATHAGLLDVADLVFDIAPPGSPASAWFVDSQGGEG